MLHDAFRDGGRAIEIVTDAGVGMNRPTHSVRCSVKGLHSVRGSSVTPPTLTTPGVMGAGANLSTSGVSEMKM